MLGREVESHGEVSEPVLSEFGRLLCRRGSGAKRWQFGRDRRELRFEC
jgi:hypothetical protein